MVKWLPAKPSQEIPIPFLPAAVRCGRGKRGKESPFPGDPPLSPGPGELRLGDRWKGNLFQGGPHPFLPTVGSCRWEKEGFNLLDWLISGRAHLGWFGLPQILNRTGLFGFVLIPTVYPALKQKQKQGILETKTSRLC